MICKTRPAPCRGAPVAAFNEARSDRSPDKGQTMRPQTQRTDQHQFPPCREARLSAVMQCLARKGSGSLLDAELHAQEFYRDTPAVAAVLAQRGAGRQHHRGLGRESRLPNDGSRSSSTCSDRQTILGRIAGLRSVPFNEQWAEARAARARIGSVKASPKPITAMSFDDAVTLDWAKIGERLSSDRRTDAHEHACRRSQSFGGN